MDNNKIGSKGETVMYSQLQPWSTVGVLPCMEQIAGPPIPIRVGEFYKTPKPHPWRPTLGYEMIEASPLPAQPITNLLANTCYMPKGMATEPLRFPNLVTGFDRNPAHAARTALFTRYGPYEWVQNQLRLYNESDSNRNFSENLRQDTVRIMRETDEKVQKGQIETGRKLGERITDTTFWRNEMASELERLIIENAKMQECRRNLQITIQSLEGQLHIAQECLYYREARTGSDLVHDQAEHALLKEVEVVRNCENKLEHFTDKCNNQLTNGRAVQNQLEIDIKNKETALGIDITCHQMNNFSRGLKYYGGIEKYDPSVTEAESWIEASNNLVKKSQTEREKSNQLRSDIEIAINAVGHEMWEAWGNTNNALARRAAEMLEAKEKLQIHLHKIQQEIFEVEKNLQLIQKAITDKSSALKVAHTRLESRTHRPAAELCKDYAQLRMIEEVETINSTIHDMNLKLQRFEAQHQQLLRTRSNLETDLKSKVDALFIDREKCMGMRRSYPIASVIKF
ncbi:tektin-3-like [Apis laboriosa]|uniref:tektin-3-like n=1 Tax=Apis dorsata TaxID=7462 RepID=UPI0003DF6836|nr:tektin-3-like [Apis dorsata]XP_043788890.1 tektin-3-like [Apis laboriosa]